MTGVQTCALPISLLLFEHVHGESRDRGQAMVDLMAQYERHGLQLDSRELPDHLPLYLEYLAQPLQEGDQKKLENGSIVLDEEPVLPARVEILEDTQILLHIQEGRFHQVKRMLHAIGNEVVHLKRIAMGPLRLDEDRKSTRLNSSHRL